MARIACPHPRGVVVALVAAALAVPGTSMVAHASGPGPGETASFSSGRPGPDLFSEEYVQERVRRCTGMDLLLRDTATGEGLSLGPADGPGRSVPLPSDEPGRYALECSDGYLVELEGPARPESLETIAALVPGAGVVQRFDGLFNGLHVRMSPAAAQELRAGGFAVWENAEVRATLRESVPLINADDVWNSGTPVEGAPGLTGQTGRGSTIAILDTGIDYRHPDLGNGCFGVPAGRFKESPCKVIGGYDVFNGDPDPVDDHGHGTHVAAIAAGNGVLKGVAPDAKLYAYKVLNKYGWGTFDGVIEGLERAVDPNGDGRFSDAADVINLSLGGFGNPEDPLSEAVDNAVRMGSVVAVAAGNASYGETDEEGISTPGTSRDAITVGASTKPATTKPETIASFSSRGPVVWDGRSIVKPDLVAPGHEICAARHGTAWASRTCFDQLHVSLSGTSMAAPHVAGVVALMEEARPALTPAEVKSILKGSSVRPTWDQSVVAQGAGRVDAFEAVAATEEPLVAALDPIAQTGSVRTIAGTVGGAVREWRLDYAPYYASNLPEQWWNELVRSAGPSAERVLHQLPVSGLPDGRYIISLTVQGIRGRQAVDYGYVEVDKVRLAHPTHLDVLRLGDAVEVRADVDPSVTDPEFVLESAPGYNSPWTTVARSGSPRMTWDTNGLPAGAHRLRLSVHHDGIVDREQAVVVLDPRLAPGWPVRIPNAFSCPSTNVLCAVHTGWADPVAEDLDGDGTTEFLVLRFAPIPELRAYRADGSLAWSTPVGDTAGSGPGFLALFYLHLPVVADLDGDGQKEILVFNTIDSALYVYSATGGLQATWPVPMAAGAIPYLPRMALADVNADGIQEVVLSLVDFDEYWGSRPRILVIGTDSGATLANWLVTEKSPQTITFLGADYNYAPAVANLDPDAALEIVAVEGNGSTIRAFDWNGAELGQPEADAPHAIDGVTGGVDPPGWPVEGQSGREYFPVTAGDLDGDGDDEVVAGLLGGSALTRIWVLDAHGRPLPGWPVSFTDRISSAGASLGDLDGDGDLEIIVPVSGQVAAFHHDGRPVAGWPAPTNLDAAYPAVVGDVDGDRAPDVMVHASNAVFGSVRAWSGRGTPLPGFDLPLEPSSKTPLLATDIGGRVGLVASSDSDLYWNSKGQKESKGRISIHLWQLSPAYDGQAMPWPMYQHDVGRTGNGRVA